MTVVSRPLTQLTIRLQRFFTFAWYTLRRPSITGLFLLMVALVGLAGLIIPQMTEAVAPEAARVVWRDGLPLWLQPVREVLLFLGLAQIFYSLWFWLPAALLLLNSLVALAEYTPGSWLRVGQMPPPLEWQHPLARRVELSVRLSILPDDFLEQLQARLLEQGFLPYLPADRRRLVAGQRRWGWLGVTAIYAGLVGLVAAFLLTHYFLATDRLTLLPAQPTLSFAGKFELAGFENNLIQVNYTPVGQLSSERLTWRLYWPTFVGNTFIFPLAVDPFVSIEARDAANNLFKIEALRESLPPAEHLRLPLNDPVSPPAFTILGQDLAVSVSFDPAAAEVYLVQARRNAGTLVLEKRVKAGESFAVEDVSVLLTPNYTITVLARRDPAWPLYLAAAALILSGLNFTWLRPPALVWLLPETKGLGGQLYGVIETFVFFGSEERLRQFLQNLLAESKE